MCAIHGFCWTDEDAGMARMVQAAHHRGPDGKGVWADRHLSLGHNLLAITDTAAVSGQPLVRGPRILVYNGEAYNYRDLRPTLDHRFETDSDTEVVAVGLEREGAEFLRRVDGMFALAYYDNVRGDLTLARDSNGAKPLYYGYLNGKLAFSSEIRSLLALGFDRVVSKEAFRHYYHAGLVAGRLTMFEGIYKLVPGEVATFNLITGTEHRWNLNDRPVPVYAGPKADLPDLLAERLKRAVALTLTGRREIGMFLSGGMDSSAVLHEAASLYAPGLRTFTTRFVSPVDRAVCNQDADVARDLAKLYGAHHREVLVGEQEWIDNAERVALALEEPRQGRSHPAYYLTNRAAGRSGVVVTLSGDGGDELLMGYKHHKPMSFRDRFETMRSRNRDLRNPELALSVDEQCRYLYSWLPRGGMTGDAVNDLMYVECLHTLAEDFLIRNDKLGAAFSMEARFPMLCSVFRDFVRGVPSSLKGGKAIQSGGWDLNNKLLLRRAYAGKLPEYVTAKNKTGWRAPTDDWVIGRRSRPAPDTGVMRTYFRDLLAEPQIRSLFEIDDHIVETRYLNNRDFSGAVKASGKTGDGIGIRSQKELFTVVMFALWFKAFGMRLW